MSLLSELLELLDEADRYAPDSYTLDRDEVRAIVEKYARLAADSE